MTCTTRATLLLLAITAPLATGCTRTYYRIQADEEVSCLVARNSDLTRDPLDMYGIGIGPDSRMFYEYDPDKSPMPKDDPAAHVFMECVEGMRGWPHWTRYGIAPSVDEHTWEAFLPYDEEGAVVLDLAGAVEVARVNSREFQDNLETLYLSALDVTFERFRFDAQFFGGNDTFYTADGRLRSGTGSASSRLSTITGLERRKMYAAGGELIAGIANTFIWQFAGADTESVNTLLDFSFFQPLLRGGGRALILERLTRSERDLLANIRQMERWRRGFYVETVTGQSAGRGPNRTGGFFGGAGLEGFSGVGAGGFGQVGGAVGGGGAGGTGGGGTGAAQAGGYMGLLQDLQNIRNQQANIVGLRKSLLQLEAAYDAGRIDRFQVDFARQALYSAQSRLLNLKVGFETTLDGFKIEMGLPPTLRLIVQDPLLEQFNLVNPTWSNLQEEIVSLLIELRNTAGGPGLNPEAVDAFAARLAQMRGQAEAETATITDDLRELDEQLPRRRANLRDLAAQAEAERGDVDPDAFSIENLDNRVERVHTDYARLSKEFAESWDLLEELNTTGGDAAERGRRLDALATQLSNQMLEMSLVQGRARLDKISLVPFNLESGEAYEIAHEYRRDWMNARSNLVNTWRLIQFNANALEAGLNIVFEGDLGTVGDNPVNFRNTNGRLRAGVEFDAPLTRLAERNIYRQSLIDFQQARRSYMLFEDSVSQVLRARLRQIELNKLNFELRRQAVLVAIDQVDVSQLRLSQPPRPGETATFGDTLGRDLVSALADLLQAQNDFLSVWVNYEVQRIAMDFDLGTMELDSHGLWIDPGPVGAGDNEAGAEMDELMEVPEVETLPPLEEGLERPLPDVELLLPPPDEGPLEQPEQTEGWRLKRTVGVFEPRSRRKAAGALALLVDYEEAEYEDTSDSGESEGGGEKAADWRNEPLSSP